MRIGDIGIYALSRITEGIKMKWVNKLALFCIVCGIIFFAGGIIFDRTIGGNADGGYRKEGVYMVYNEKQAEYIQVSKSVWYANYVYTQLKTFFIYLGFVSIGYFYTMYVSIPLAKKVNALNRKC